MQWGYLLKAATLIQVQGVQHKQVTATRHCIAEYARLECGKRLLRQVAVMPALLVSHGTWTVCACIDWAVKVWRDPPAVA